MGIQFDRDDYMKNRLGAALGYFVFFLPLIFCSESKLGRYCANQGLLLMLLWIAVNIVFGILGIFPLIGWIFRLGGKLIRLLVVLFELLCFVQLMTNEKAIEIPVIGGIRIIR